MTYTIEKQATIQHPLISVITPSYNVASYIEEQLNSLLVQSLKPIEIVVIDDGSTDETLAILTRLAQQHPELTVVSQANAGPSAARNVGLELFRGEYVYFVDADDVVPADALKKLYTTAVKEGADITTGVSLSFNSTSSWFIGGHFNNGLFRPGVKNIVSNPELVYSLGPASKLYRAGIVKELRMPTTIKIGEDQPFVLEALLKSEKIVTIPDIVYNYRSREDEEASLSQIVNVEPLKTFMDIKTSITYSQPLFKKYLGTGITGRETAIAYFDRVIRADLWPAVREILKSKKVADQQEMFKELAEMTNAIEPALFAEDLFFFRMLTIEMLDRFTFVTKGARPAYFQTLNNLFSRLGPGPLNLLSQELRPNNGDSKADKKMRALLKASRRNSAQPIILFLVRRKSTKLFREGMTLLGRKLKTLQRVLAGMFLRRVMFPVYKVVMKKKNIVFLTNKEATLGGSFKPIYNQLLSQKVPGEIKTHLKVKERNFREMNQLLKDVAAAKQLFLDDYYRQLYGLKVSKKTEVTQLWHAAGAFKKFGYSAIGGLDSNPVEFERRAHQNYTSVICSSAEIVPFYAEAFNIAPEKVYPLGIPRADILLDSEYLAFKKARLLGKYPEIKGRKIVTYAPTFRGGPKERTKFKLELNMRKFVEKFASEYILIIKMHPSVTAGQVVPFDLKGDVLVLNQIDMNDLLIATDVLITDYSSVIFDFSLLKRPMLFFAYDLDEYILERSFYYDYRSLVPGPIASTNDELLSALAQIEQFDLAQIETFKDRFFAETDGKSAEKIVSKLFATSASEN